MIWANLARWAGCEALAGAARGNDGRSTEQVQQIARATRPEHRKGIKSITILAPWEIWKEQNNCTFRGKTRSVKDVLDSIRRGVDLWRQAGAGCLQSPFAEPPAGIG